MESRAVHGCQGVIGSGTKKPFLRLRFATPRPSQVLSALGASACVHESNHIGMAL